MDDALRKEAVVELEAGIRSTELAMRQALDALLSGAADAADQLVGAAKRIMALASSVQAIATGADVPRWCTRFTLTSPATGKPMRRAARMTAEEEGGPVTYHVDLIDDDALVMVGLVFATARKNLDSELALHNWAATQAEDARNALAHAWKRDKGDPRTWHELRDAILVVDTQAPVVAYHEQRAIIGPTLPKTGEELEQTIASMAELGLPLPWRYADTLESLDAEMARRLVWGLGWFEVTKRRDPKRTAEMERAAVALLEHVGEDWTPTVDIAKGYNGSGCTVPLDDVVAWLRSYGILQPEPHGDRYRRRTGILRGDSGR